MPRNAEISVVVLAVHGDRRAAVAAASVLADAPRTEVVVVNTGLPSLAAELGPLLQQVVLVEADDVCLPGGARNLGIAESTAGIVAFLAADCRVTSGWTDQRLAAHRAGASAVASALRPAPDERGRIAGVSWAAYALMHSRRAPECPAAAAARYGVSYDRTLLQRYGLFRDDIRIGEDTEFNGRIAAETAIAWAPQVLTLHDYPSRLGQALTEMFERGRQLYRWNRGRARHPLWASVRRTIGSWLMAEAFPARTEGEVRRRLRRATPAVALLALAYAGGSVVAAARRGA